MNHLRMICVCMLMIIAANASAKKEQEHTLLLLLHEPLPQGAKPVGDKLMNVRLGNMDAYNILRKKIDRTARKVGGNMARITEVKPPDMTTDAYRITFTFYQAEDIAAAKAHRARLTDSSLRSLRPDTVSYALLLLYRPQGGPGIMSRYNVHIEDTKLWRAIPDARPGDGARGLRSPSPQ